MFTDLLPLPADFLDQVISVTLRIALVLNIPACVPMILALKGRGAVIRPGLSTATALAIMLIFLFAGEPVLARLDIHRDAFLCAGAVVLMGLALELTFNIQLFHTDLSDASSAAIIPIAFPIMTGMGTLTTIAGLQQQFHLAPLLLGILFNTCTIYGGLYYLEGLHRALGKKGNQVIKMVVGVLLIAVSLQMLKVHFLGLESKPW